MVEIRSASGRNLTVGKGETRILGILNVTPDSFADGGRFLEPAAAAAHAETMVAEGAAAIDIGGESTRPGHRPVPPAEQLDRILPVLEAVRSRVEVPIAIDTTWAEVAGPALAAGADWVNDTTALGEDPSLAPLVAEHGCPVILMHRFVPARKADGHAERGAVMEKILEDLRDRLRVAHEAGVRENQILLDPGVGFGTLADDNPIILAHLEQLKSLRRPIVVGPSRKSFLWHLTGRAVDDRLLGTAAAVAAAALEGADIVRVHDVREMRDVVLVADAIRQARS